MTAKSSPLFTEMGELFGPPSDDARLSELQGLLNSMLGQPDIEPGLRRAMVLAEKVESELYGDVAVSALNLMTDGIEFERLKAFFHRAAAFGEARYASRLVSNIHLAVLLKSPPTEVS